jgi:hypothetical protein
MAATVRDIDHGFKALFGRLEGAKNARTLTVGVHDAEGGAPTASGRTVGEVATINEYGLGVPERSFIRAWFDETEQANIEILRKIGRNIVQGKGGNYTQGLEQAGLAFVGQIQGKIAGGIAPENAPSTVARKGSSTPLVNTGQLKSSIRHKVNQV